MKSNELIVYTDGGARGNPGQAAVGVFIQTSTGKLYSLSKAIGIATNNIAEYKAVLYALDWISENIKDENLFLHFYLDSQLVCRQLSGIYKIKNLELKALFKTYTLAVSKKQFNVSFHEIPRQQNKIADSLVNQALDKL